MTDTPNQSRPPEWQLTNVRAVNQRDIQGVSLDVTKGWPTPVLTATHAWELAKALADAARDAGFVPPALPQPNNEWVL